MTKKTLMALLAACVLAVPQAAAAQSAVSARPGKLAETSATNFDQSLRCMDDLLSRSRYVNGVKISVGSLSEAVATGAVTRDMMITALARMSEKSRAFRIAADVGPEDIANAARTDIFVGGSVTAWEKDIGEKGPEAGVSVGPLNLGFRNRKIDSTLSITLFLQDSQGIVIPLTTQSLTMALRQQATGGDVSGSVGLLGGYVAMDFAGGDAPMQALRALIDLSLIQAVGAWAQVPYQRCLAISQTDPEAVRKARQAWTRLPPGQRIGAIAVELQRRGLYAGPATETMTPQLRLAISDFQVQAQLPPLGLPNFETWFALRGSSFGTVSAPPMAPVAASETKNVLGLNLAPHGPNFVSTSRDFYLIQTGYRASFAVSTLRDAHVACFYADARQQVTKVFPSDQRPADQLAAGQVLVIPGPNDIFSVVPQVAGRGETMTCVASSAPLAERLPATLRPNLRPGAPSLPFGSSADIIAALRAAAIPDLSISVLSFAGACPDPETGQLKLQC